MTGRTVTAKELNDGTLAVCKRCGFDNRDIDPSELYGLCNGLTTDQLESVDSWICTHCFHADHLTIQDLGVDPHDLKH